MLKNFGHFEKVQLLFGKILSLIWQILCDFGQKLSFADGQILNQYTSHLVTLAMVFFSYGVNIVHIF